MECRSATPNTSRDAGLTVVTLSQALVDGLLIGGVYALIGVGMTLIFGVMRIINASHGDLMMMAMYLAFALFTAYNLDPFVSVLVAMPALFLFGMLMYVGLIKRLRVTAEENSVILTWGVALILVNLFTLAFSGDYRSVLTDYSTSTLRFGDVALSIPMMGTFAVAVILTATLYQFLLHTNLGKGIRAIGQNVTGAQIVGINIHRVQMIAFGIGAALAGAAGAAFSSAFYMFPSVGGLFTIKAFVVIVLGGIGNVIGAFMAGLALGLAESLGGVYVSLALKDVFGFVIFIAILLLRPAGLFGRRRV